MNRSLSVLAALILLAGCGGDSDESGSESASTDPVAETPAAEETGSAGDGMDLVALKKAAGEEPTAPAEPEDTGSAEPEAPAEVPAETPEKKPEGPPPPKQLSDISDHEVLSAFDEDEREALAEMPEEERQEFLHDKRLEIFKSRGGVLLEGSGKMEDQEVDADTGMRGPARPDRPTKELPPPDLRGILQDLGSRDPETRARGAESAKRFEDKVVAARHILEVLDDPDPEIRAIAAGTLGALGQVDTIPRLETVLAKDPKPGVRAMALRAIRDIGGEASIGALQRIVADGEEPDDRASALGFLTDMEKPELVKDLMAGALDDLGFQVRQQAVRTARTFGMKRYESTMLPMLEDFDENVVLECIRAFGTFKTRSAVGPLVGVLVKPDPEWENPDGMQDAAATSLKAITGKDNGYSGTAPDKQRLAAIDAWRVWWVKNKAEWQ
ncbi:MAG: HEAT repeat domain-containing protein [Planctomycetota bacterium]|jgi:HEAT repeat protein